MAIVTGIEKIYVAIQTKDDATGLTYGTPKYYAGIQEIDIKPKQNTTKAFAENILWEQATGFDSAEVSISLLDLTSAERAELLGQDLAAEGGTYATGEDVAPYVAVLYKATIKGGYRYGVLYKGAFGLPEDNIKGQEGKVDFQSQKMTATFQPTRNNKKWEYHVDTTDPDCPANIDTTWFTTVKIPTKKTA
ncbi:MAG TPA: major tail protein [Clostridia bacterium]